MAHSPASLKVISRGELAKRTGLGVRHLSRLAAEGLIPGTELLDGRRFERAFPLPLTDELEKWIKLRQAKRKPKTPVWKATATPNGLNLPSFELLAVRATRLMAHTRFSRLAPPERRRLMRALEPVVRLYKVLGSQTKA